MKTQSLRGLIPFVIPYKPRIALAALFLLLAAGATLSFPMALKRLVDLGLSTTASSTQLAVYFGELFGVAALLAIFSSLRFYMVTWLGERITADIRNAVYSHVIQQSPRFFETTSTGEVLSRLSSDTTLIQTVVGSSLSMGLRNGLMGLGALTMLVWTNPILMLQVIGVLVLVVWPSVMLGRRVRRLSRTSQDRVADSSAIASEVLNAIGVVQSYTAEKREAQRFTQSTLHVIQAALERTRARSILVGFIILASSAALLWGLFQGAVAVRNGTMTAGDLSQTVVYIIMLAGAFAVLGEVYGDILRAAGASERLLELLHTQSEINSPTHALSPAWPTKGSDIQLNGVEFFYPSRPQQAAIHQLSGHIQAGQTVAIVGPSGAGKSSLLSLLLRFYDPQQGHLLLDGIELKNYDLHALRQRIAIVPQEAIIFAGTALENIRYGNPEATYEQVIQAAQAAFAHEFITELPEGYDTDLGEKGVRLSGGQKQRIAIARAILKNPPLLLLDEATSALDAHSERMVQAALDHAMRDRTTVVIAHRLATVQKADVIWVMDRGQLVEQGTHSELLAQNGLYARLAALQFSH